MRGLVVVRGAGDIATGSIVRMRRAGFSVAALEVPAPSAIRRTVSLSEAVYDGEAEVEGVRAVLVPDAAALREVLSRGDAVPVLVDPAGASLPDLAPRVLLDAILAKRNLGTARGMAPLVLALGPGFTAGVDVDAVIETNRGHDLGRVLREGPAQADTGLPGLVGGQGEARVLRSPAEGPVEARVRIGDRVRAGDPLLSVGGVDVCSRLDGVVRGLIRPGFPAWKGLKVADVDPRGETGHCWTISDKARAVGGGVLEAILWLGAP
jgi:xanthine dehydrogenase accessory factor